MAKDTHVLERPPEGASPDWTIPQDWAHYTPEEHATWDILFARQAKLLPGRASQAYLRGLDALRLSNGGIPNFEELSERLM
jgi:phenylalanine-4-hydroxylase